MTRRRVVLVDGTNLAHRGFHAAKQRVPIESAMVVGFRGQLVRALNEAGAEFGLIAWEGKGAADVRRSTVPTYKLNRSRAMGMDDRIKEAYWWARESGFVCLSFDSFEADDVVATCARMAREAGHDAIIASDDKDMLQALGARVTQYKPSAKRVVDQFWVFREYGVPPERIPDLFALVGDSADGLSGVRGLGPQRARELLERFGTLDNLFANVEQVQSKSIRVALVENMNLALATRAVVRLRTDVPVERNPWRPLPKKES